MDWKSITHSDVRSADEIAKQIQHLGYEPVWKDWDAALTV
jgi:2-iminoacetate synthase ThiH